MHTARTALSSAREARVHLLRERLAASALDALLVGHLPNVLYLSGYSGTSASLLVTAYSQFFITDFRYHGRLGGEVADSWILADSTKLSVAELLAQLLPAGARVGIEAEYLSLAEYAALDKPGHCSLVQTNRLVGDLRQLKDQAEQAALHHAAQIGADVFTGLLPWLKPGIREREIAAEIEYRARLAGASACSFKPIIACGERSALPHALFTDAPLLPNVPLVIDMGVVVDGYCSDMTRTLFLGDCPAPWRGLYALVDEARAAGQAALRPGITGAAADKAARELLAAGGYGAHFGHGLGHGVGIEIHEDPRLKPGSGHVLAAGHVVTCEPGVYLPGAGGIRIENMCLVTDSGAECLTPLGSELLVL